VSETKEKYPFEVCNYKEVSEIAAVELAGINNIRYDQIKMPAGGGMAFELPGETPESPRIAKEIIGVIAYHYPQNAYWVAPYTGNGTMPDCFSKDGIYGEDRNGTRYECAVCKYNQYGSRNAGKACKNMHQLFIIESGAGLPLVLNVPPSSAIRWDNFRTKIVFNERLWLSQCLVKIGLKKAKNRDLIEYSELTFEKIRQLDTDTWKVIIDMASAIKQQGKADMMIEGPLTTPGAPIYDDDDLPF